MLSSRKCLRESSVMSLPAGAPVILCYCSPHTAKEVRGRTSTTQSLLLTPFRIIILHFNMIIYNL